MDNSQKNSLDSLGNIEQVRELLFGSQLKNITAAIEDLNGRFDQLQESVETSLILIKEELNQRVKEDLDGMHKRLKQFNAQRQEEIHDVHDQSLKLERRMQTAIEVRSQEIEDSIKANKTALHREVDAIKTALNNVHKEMTEQLHTVQGDISEHQISKEYMGEMLMNMALQFKGVTLDVEAEETVSK